MQLPGSPPLDVYLSSIRVTRAQFRGKVKAILTGHNDRALVGETYLDNLESAAQALVDKGASVLIPSYRPAGQLQVVTGDRIKDPNWVAINVNKDRFLSAPSDKIATLSNIEIAGASLGVRFLPATHDYAVTAPHGTTTVRIAPVATSTRYKALTVDGAAAASGTRIPVKLDSPRRDVTIVVTSPDGAVTTTYKVTVSRAE